MKFLVVVTLAILVSGIVASPSGRGRGGYGRPKPKTTTTTTTTPEPGNTSIWKQFDQYINKIN